MRAEAKQIGHGMISISRETGLLDSFIIRNAIPKFKEMKKDAVLMLNKILMHLILINVFPQEISESVFLSLP